MSGTCDNTGIYRFGECLMFRILRALYLFPCLSACSRQQPRDDRIVRLWLSWPFPLTLPLRCWVLRFGHDALRKRVSPDTWFELLLISRNIVDFHFLPWCVLLNHGRDSSTSSIPGVFIVLFSASVIIFVFVLSRGKVAYFSKLLKLDRRKGFSNRATAAVFAATVINFILSSVNTGITISGFIIYIRTALLLNIDYPLLEKPELAGNAPHYLAIVSLWAVYFPVSIKLSVGSRIY